MGNALEPNRSPCFGHGARTASDSEAQPAAAGPGATAAEAARPTALASLSGYPARVAGCLMAKMCGDVLGAAVEGWSAEDVVQVHPEGLTSFSMTDRGFGCYTDDTQMAVALVRSLLERGGACDDVRAALSYAAEYQRHRGYGGTAYKILEGIKSNGIDATSIATIGTKYISGGSFGNGGVMRIAPLGLVYRHAPPEALRSAVVAALRCTHVHPTAVDGAFVVALAAGYLASRQPGPAPGTGPGSADPAAAPQAVADSAGSAAAAVAGSHEGADECAGAGPGRGDGGVATPAGLLEYLLGHRGQLETEEMADKLRILHAALRGAPHFKSASEPWADYLASAGWQAELRLQAAVAEPFQIRADDAAAASIAALCWHWSCPEDAIVAAVHYGGDTDTVAAITGALAGALHGVSWLPLRWWDNLENGRGGRDEVLGLAEKLAVYDTRA